MTWLTAIATFLEIHNGAVTATATVFIAAFTIVLVLVTGRQARLTRESIDLARQEFIASHRPVLRIRLLAHEPFIVGKSIVIRFTISNIGDSPARGVTYDVILRMSAVGDVGKIRWQGKGARQLDVIPPGGSADVVHTTDVICPSGDFAAFAPDRFVVGGLVGYSDDNGVVRMTSFRRVKNKVGQGAFRHLEPFNPDYEYES